MCVLELYVDVTYNLFHITHKLTDFRSNKYFLRFRLSKMRVRDNSKHFSQNILVNIFHKIRVAIFLFEMKNKSLTAP